MDGRTSQLNIVPFYDRTELIEETIGTLNEALLLEILITVLVIIVMVYNLRASILISGLLPVAVLMVFIAMKMFGVAANIVALSGIAIAIGTMVDIGVILCENILRHRDEKYKTKQGGSHFHKNTVVYNATVEVSGAIITAVMTTIISFIPVFTMIGAEGKLFRPLAFTKTMALSASIVITLFLIPPFAALLFRSNGMRSIRKYGYGAVVLITGIAALALGYWMGGLLLAFGLIPWLQHPALAAGGYSQLPLSEKQATQANIGVAVLSIVFLLANYWRPLGFDRSIVMNLIFVGIICFGLLGTFWLFRKNYSRILQWALRNKNSVPLPPYPNSSVGYWHYEKHWKRIYACTQ